jgi:hypothetical protein
LSNLGHCISKYGGSTWNNHCPTIFVFVSFPTKESNILTSIAALVELPFGGTHHAQTNYDLARYVQGFIVLHHKGLERIGEIQKAFG